MGGAIKSLMAIAALAGVLAFSSGAMAQTPRRPRTRRRRPKTP